MRRTDRLRARSLLLLALAGAASATTPNGLPGVPQPAPASAPSVQPAWASMTPQQKRDLRARYAAWQALPDAEKLRVRRAGTALVAMPAAERQALQARFAGMDQMHREGWLLGPRLGAAYARLQPLLGYLPAAQREPMLSLLEQLDADSLEQLSLISQRTPPQDRAALREALLAVAPAQRAAWLREKVGH